MPPAETHALLKRELTQCYQRSTTALAPAGGVLVPASNATLIEEELGASGSSSLSMRIMANGRSVGYSQLVEIRTNSQCMSEVVVHELNSNWQRHTRRIDSWLKGEKVEGCGVW
jgi:hypothetical protein